MPRKRKASGDYSSSRSKKAASSRKSEKEDEILDNGFDGEAVIDITADISPKKTTYPLDNRFDGEAVVDIKADISPKKASPPSRKLESEEEETESRFLGEPVSDEEARQKWPHRYPEKKGKQGPASKASPNDNSEDTMQARCHYTQAEVDGHTIFNLYDDAYVKGEEGKDNYICKIIEMFEAIDGTLWFTSQWFYRARDTVIQKHGHLIDVKRVFFSEVKDTNPLECLLQTLKIVRVPLNVDLEAHKEAIAACDYYYNMLYLLPYSTFRKVPEENVGAGSETFSTISSEVNMNGDVKSDSEDASQVQAHQKSEMTVLDLYSGCGAMSTGLCLGANISGINLVTRWAVDINSHACESLKLNHPETEVRNESAEDFLSLLKEWQNLCILFSLVEGDVQGQYFDPTDGEDDESDEDGNDKNSNGDEDDGEVFEVEKILSICYGDPKEKGERGLYFKVRWKGYGPTEDTWEPIDGLRHCKERIKDFVVIGNKSRILPLPGNVDVVCGGPPCQGISGFNRFRNKQDPLKDPKNEQLLVYMNVVDFLKPKFVLMENVVDIVRFSDGFLGRYALGRLIQMNYQARIGMMAAGAYGLPQFRMRVFLWGARSSETLPQYPLPTHDVIVRGVIPLEFEGNTVAYNEGHSVKLERKLLLEDAISDLPPVRNDERRDEMPYGQDPQTEFQQFIRLGKDELLDSSTLHSQPTRKLVYDHRPLQLNADDYERVCQIPKRKGANFRDLPGVRVRPDNKVEFDPDVERVLLSSGKPLVPDYAMTFVKGSSSKPFARLWWDETVPTVVTRAEPHNQQILHPVQDRVLSIRENARLQGFPDCYKLCGPVKERYIQVGNAVAIPVARALGYALGMACQGSAANEPLFALPAKFPNILEPLSPVSSEDNS